MSKEVFPVPSEIAASAANVEDDGYCTVISFADETAHPPNYLTLQVVNKPTLQDIQLGQDGVHFEYGDQARGGYDVVRAINLKEDCIEILLWKDAAERAGLDEQIVIHLKAQQQVIENIRSSLKLISSRLKQR